MSSRPPPHSEEPEISEDERHVQRAIRKVIKSRAAQQISQPTSLSRLQPPTVTSPSTIGNAVGAVPVVHDQTTGREITPHEAVRRRDADALQFGRATSRRYVRRNSDGSSPAAVSGSGVDEGTDAAIRRHFFHSTDAADPQLLPECDIAERCKSELMRPKYTIVSGDVRTAMAFQPLPRPKLIGGGLLQGPRHPSSVQPAAATAADIPSDAGSDAALAPTVDTPPLDQYGAHPACLHSL